jgi:hypothetical protein
MVEFSTTEYQFSHGKQPRGYGSWAFFFGSETEPQWHTGTFSEGKKFARAYAVAKGHRFVRVGS